MSDRIKGAIEELQAQIAQKEQEVLPLKQAVNHLCKVMNVEPLYDLSDGDASGSSPNKSKLVIRIDQFFNRPLAGSVVEILTARKDAGVEGPATVDELFETLNRGGYRFEGVTGNEDNQKRSLKISLAKNTTQFVKIGENRFGLRSWYNMRAARTNGRKTAEDGQEGDEPIESAVEPVDASEAAEPKPEPAANGAEAASKPLL